MADKIAAQEGALARGAEAVQTAYTSIAASTQRVENDLGELNGAWSGGAAQGYHDLVVRWSTDAADLASVLTELENALRGTARDQAAVEDAHASVIAGLNGMMGGQ